MSNIKTASIIIFVAIIFCSCQRSSVTQSQLQGRWVGNWKSEMKITLDFGFDSIMTIYSNDGSPPVRSKYREDSTRLLISEPGYVDTLYIKVLTEKDLSIRRKEGLYETLEIMYSIDFKRVK